MNAKILFSTTLAVALASSLALADEVRPVSRDDVVADFQKARVDGTLRKNDYDYDARDFGALPTRTRDEVLAELRAPRDKMLVGFTAKSRSYNPYGSELLRMKSVSREQVKADVRTAMHDGTLRHTDYDDVPVRATRRSLDRVAAPVLAGVGTGSAVAR